MNASTSRAVAVFQTHVASPFAAVRVVTARSATSTRTAEGANVKTSGWKIATAAAGSWKKRLRGRANHCSA